MTEKKLWTVRTDDDEENDTFSSYVALDDVNVFEAAELDAIALVADTRNDGVATRQHLSTSPKNYVPSIAVLEDINLEKMERV